MSYSEKLTSERTDYLKQIAEQSIEDQLIKEKSDNKSFDEFLQDYMNSDFWKKLKLHVGNDL